MLRAMGHRIDSPPACACLSGGSRLGRLLLGPALLGFCLLAPEVAMGQEPAPESGPTELVKDVPHPQTTRLKLWAGDERQDVDVSVGHLPLGDENGKLRARVFHVSYVVPTRPGDAQRPVTFVFNGGPGSSSVWLHLGGLSPYRVSMGVDGLDGGAENVPFILEENRHTILGSTDLVFLDPVSTGHSRAAEGVDASQFHGLEADADSMADAIRLWIGRNKRWPAPKFLCGESYGTTRAATLSRRLQQNHGIELEGVILISAVLDFATLRPDPGNDLVYPLLLPTFAAIAAYHGRLPVNLDQEQGSFLAEAESFALEVYMPALAMGNRLAPERRKALAERLSGYTGLTAQELLDCNLRPTVGIFTKALLRDERSTVGRLDGRFLGRDALAVGAEYEYDPSYAAILGPFTSAMNHLLSETLGWQLDQPYEILTGAVNPWPYPEGRYPSVTADLRQAMARNSHLQVFVAEGIYDLATPYFAMRHTMAQLGWEATYMEHVTIRRYEAGHMMYIRPADNMRLGADLAAFYAGVLKR